MFASLLSVDKQRLYNSIWLVRPVKEKSNVNVLVMMVDREIAVLPRRRTWAAKVKKRRIYCPFLLLFEGILKSLNGILTCLRKT